MDTRATKFFCPCDHYRSVISGIREDAERAGDTNLREAAYAVAWFMGTGRSFVGIERALSHATHATVVAFVRRVRDGMVREAAKAGRTHVVTGDLSNTVLASAFGYEDGRTAEMALCTFPYGSRFTLSSAGARVTRPTNA